MLPTIVMWKWSDPSSHRYYDYRHVNRVIRQYQENCSEKLSFLCFTDDPAKIACETAPLPCEWESNYRRIWMFSPEAERVLPKRIFLTDLDVVVSGNLDALFRRREDLVVMTDPGHRPGNRGFSFLHTPGTYPDIYAQFNPLLTPAWLKVWFPTVYGRRLVGNDDAWLTAYLWQKPIPLMFQYRARTSWGGSVPGDVRIIHFPGSKTKPWSKQAALKYAWLTPRMQEL